MLSVSGNQLTDLPEEVTQLPRLQQLICDNNQINSLPETIGRSKQLTKLYVHKNCLEALPEVWSGFSSIYDHVISTQSIGDCQLLLLLDVSSNQLSYFPKNVSQTLSPHQAMLLYWYLSLTGCH